MFVVNKSRGKGKAKRVDWQIYSSLNERLQTALTIEQFLSYVRSLNLTWTKFIVKTPKSNLIHKTALCLAFVNLLFCFFVHDPFKNKTTSITNCHCLRQWHILLLVKCPKSFFIPDIWLTKSNVVICPLDRHRQMTCRQRQTDSQVG